MKFVQLPVLLLVIILTLLKIAKKIVRRAVPVMRTTSLVEIVAFPSQNAAASTMTATTNLAKCFIPVDNVKKDASVNKTAR